MADAQLELGASRQQIDAASRRFEEAFRTGNPERTADLYSHDARVLPPGAPLIHGSDGAGAFWQAATQQLGITAVRLHTQELEVYGDRAHELGQGFIALAGGHEVVAKYVVLWKQEDGQWRIDVDIWNMDS